MKNQGRKPNQQFCNTYFRWKDRYAEPLGFQIHFIYQVLQLE